ncbi:Hypothetical predicted protein [Lecanosticta acicola]|uniref:Methyltransferase domain-containing protein n=1 Tax=Lecanosticta acicola TaxID=111012 RepID=A0AAI8Z7R0_9PEZI|nr:Hypothetical predicted protein [Lecanosticta acicola]
MDWLPGWRRPDFLKSKRGRNRVEDEKGDEARLVDDLFPGFKMTEEDGMLARRAYCGGTGSEREPGGVREREREKEKEKGVPWGYMLPLLEALMEEQRKDQAPPPPPPPPAPGMGIRILDVGCGAGKMAIDLAKRLGPAGEVVGVDLSAAILSSARAQAEMETTANVRFLQGDVYSLPLEAAAAAGGGGGGFDVVSTHQVLAHCREPVRAIKELMRAARKGGGGGMLCLREGDLLTAKFFPEDAVLGECFDVIRRVHASQGGAVEAGRQLQRWVREAGVERENFEVSYRAWVYETAEERREYGGHWPARCTLGMFAERAMELGVSRERLEQYALAWKRWVEDPRGRFVMIHAEVVARV